MRLSDTVSTTTPSLISFANVSVSLLFLSSINIEVEFLLSDCDLSSLLSCVFLVLLVSSVFLVELEFELLSVDL